MCNMWGSNVYHAHYLIRRIRIMGLFDKYKTIEQNIWDSSIDRAEER